MAGFIETLLIDLATANPPPGREAWSHAMRAEFEVLEHGRAGWALGCLGASLGWRLRADWVFVAGFLVASILDFGAFHALVTFALLLVIPRDDWMQLANLYAAINYELALAPIVFCCGALAAYRPRYWLFAGLVTPILDNLISIWFMVAYFHQPLSVLARVRIMDARFDIGFGAELGYGLVAALIGRGLSEYFGRKPAKAA